MKEEYMYIPILVHKDAKQKEKSMIEKFVETAKKFERIEAIT